MRGWEKEADDGTKPTAIFAKDYLEPKKCPLKCMLLALATAKHGLNGYLASNGTFYNIHRRLLIFIWQSIKRL